MPTIHCQTVARLVLLFLFAGPLACQVPDGWFAVSSFTVGSATPGGLFLVHPRNPGPPVVVQGLGPDLTGVGLSGSSGANCVAIEQELGTVLVSEVGPPGTSIDVHRLVIAGNLAIEIGATPVGVVRPGAPFGGGVTQIAMLPDGDAILAVADLVNQPPLNGAMLARYSPNTGLLTPIPTLGFSSWPNAVAVDRSGNTIYVAVLGVGLFALPVAGGTPQLITTMVTGSTTAGLAVDSQGMILASSLDSVKIVDPASGAVTTLGTVGANINGLGIEAATDQPITVLNGLSAAPGVHWCTTGGTANLLTTGITGCGSGIAARHTPRAYGQATTGNVAYRWRVAGAPGGLPRVGNAGFAVQIDAVGPLPNPGFLVANWQAGNTMLLGMQVLIDTNQAVTIGLITPGTPVGAPIPQWVAGGQPFCFQAFFIDAGAPQGFAASNGQMVVTIQ